MASVKLIESGQKQVWREKEELIDALPYADDLPPAWKAQVDQLIEEEMRRSKKKPSDFLDQLPPMPELKLKTAPLVKAEFQRMAAGKPMAPLDTSRYSMEEPPLKKKNDVSAWEEATGNAHAQIEHQHLRLLNLELLVKYGANGYRVSNTSLDAALKTYEAELGDVKKEVESLNRNRKLNQLAAGGEIKRLEAQWYSLVDKNMDIAAGCKALEAEVNALKQKCKKMGKEMPAEVMDEEMMEATGS